jgi:heat shock protein HslJ
MLCPTVALMGCAQTPPAATPLAGVEWLLIELPGHALPSSAGDAPRPTLRIDGDPPRAIGNTAVNNFVGTARLSSGGEVLRFGPLATTRRAGPPAAMQLETTYLAALDRTRSYRTGPGTLDLLDAEGQTVARFATAAAATRR